MSFRDIAFQDKAIEFLKRSQEAGKLSHSLLFFGPEAVGKREVAITLAKALNCNEGKEADSCDSCPSCKKIDGLSHPDVHWIGPEGAGNVIKIASIRAMQKKINLKPFEGQVKFFIIDRAHLLAEEAANSLLKTLEEPPKETVIILITNDLEKIFPTIRSRCQWVLFSQASPGELKEILKKKYTLSEVDAHFLSHLSEGRIGKAIAIKEEGGLKWKNAIIDGFTMENIIANEDALYFGNKREKVLDIMDVMISWYRDMLILANGADAALVINADRIDDLIKKANALSEYKIRELLAETLKMRAYIEQNVNPKLALSNLAFMTEQ